MPLACSCTAQPCACIVQGPACAFGTGKAAPPCTVLQRSPRACILHGEGCTPSATHCKDPSVHATCREMQGPVHAFCMGNTAPPSNRIAKIPPCMHFAWGENPASPSSMLQRSLCACILHGESTVHPRAPRCKDLSCILQGNAGPAACIFARGTPRPPAARCKPPPPRRCTHLHGSAHAGVVQQRVLQLPQQPAEKEQDLLPHPGGVLQGGGGDTTSAAPQPESCLHLLPPHASPA